MMKKTLMKTALDIFVCRYCRNFFNKDYLNQYRI